MVNLYLVIYVYLFRGLLANAKINLLTVVVFVAVAMSFADLPKVINEW